MEYIQLKERTGLKRFGIKTQDGADTGEYIEIDIEDLDLPIKANLCQIKHVENYNKLKEQLLLAAKEPDEREGIELITKKQKAVIEAYKEFYAEEEKALDEFLGEGATKKLLGGKKPYVTMYDDINEYLEQIVPVLQDAEKKLEERIKTKYGTEKEDNIL